MFQRDGKQRYLGLGKFPDVSLARAREKADACRRQVADGIDPVEAKREERGREPAPRFRDFAEDYVTRQEPGWKSPRSAAQWRSSLATYAYPKIGDLRSRRSLIGVIPTWPHSSGWGYFPAGGVGLILIIVLVLVVLGRL